MTTTFEYLLQEFERPLHNPILIFFLVLLIILLSPILMSKIRFPGIIGLIISGVIVGQHGLNLIADTSAIDLLSTIGLLYIMFIAGLELDLNEFKKARNRSAVFGSLTFALPLVIGLPVCYYLLEYNFTTSLLTASMFATHTLVAYPILSRFGVTKDQAVAVTVGGTILTDSAVLIILAVIMGSAEGNLSAAFWIRLGISLTIFSVIMFYLVPRVAAWFFRNLESEHYSHYIFLLAVVFFSAFLAEVAGVEAIIGAFAAGLALNRLVPHSSALMNRVEFIGNSIFIPFFLISVGMLVDLRVFTSGYWALVVAGSLTVVALVGKWLASVATQKIFRYSKARQELIFGLSSAHAAATLAIILVGYNAGLLDENILNGTIILILVTCVIASFYTEKAARKLALEVQQAESGDFVELETEKILLPIANFENMPKLLDFSILIKNKNTDNPISLLSVVPNDEEAEINLLKARKNLDQFVVQASATMTAVDVITTIDQNIGSGITRTSKEVLADIIVLGWPTSSRNFNRFMGQKISVLLENTDKTVFVCSFVKNLVVHKGQVIVVPERAEAEKGFSVWVAKMLQLARELSQKVIIYCNGQTEAAITNFGKELSLSVPIDFRPLIAWEDFLVLSRYVQDDDMLIMVMARKGNISYHPALDRIPYKMEHYFQENSRLLVFP